MPFTSSSILSLTPSGRSGIFSPFYDSVPGRRKIKGKIWLISSTPQIICPPKFFSNQTPMDFQSKSRKKSALKSISNYCFFSLGNFPLKTKNMNFFCSQNCHLKLKIKKYFGEMPFDLSSRAKVPCTENSS